jgi:hypothetical protein
MKKNGSRKSKSQRRKEHAHENIEHAFLRVLGTNLDDFLYCRRPEAFFDAIQFDVGFNELDRAVSAGGHGLR